MQVLSPIAKNGSTPPATENALRVSVVIPVYQGESSLAPLIQEMEPLTKPLTTALGTPFVVSEVVLVHDGAVDNSARVIELLAESKSFVRSVWLSRNYGQHPATLAGMAATTGDWVVTMDEDGQHAPDDIGHLLDLALQERAQLVYAQPSNAPPHGWLRNGLSRAAKWAFTRVLTNQSAGSFSSFRLIDGEIARSLAAYCGSHVYLDGALSWVVARSTHCPLVFRTGSERPSGYNFRKLFAHFGRLVLTSGTRPLRFISLLGVFAVLLAIALSALAVWKKLTAQIDVEGWTSLIIAICFFSGCILLVLGVIAEYIGVILGITMGKPLYLVVNKPPRREKGPRS